MQFALRLKIRAETYSKKALKNARVYKCSSRESFFTWTVLLGIGNVYVPKG